MKPTGAPATRVVKSAKRVVVIGNPGGGKTTLLRKTCYQLAGDTEQERVPVFFRLPVASRAFQIEPSAKLLDVILSTIPDSANDYVRNCVLQKSSRKSEPSFADMLTTLRRKSWEDKLSTVSINTTPDDNPVELLTYLATLAG